MSRKAQIGNAIPLIGNLLWTRDTAYHQVGHMPVPS